MRPETVARFDAYMAKARKVLQEAQETTPHHWEDRALTAERERDEALNVLREINDWINVAAMRPPTPNYAITHGEIKSDQYWRSRNG